MHELNLAQRNQALDYMQSHQDDSWHTTAKVLSDAFGFKVDPIDLEMFWLNAQSHIGS